MMINLQHFNCANCAGGGAECGDPAHPGTAASPPLGPGGWAPQPDPGTGSSCSSLVLLLLYELPHLGSCGSEHHPQRIHDCSW